MARKNPHIGSRFDSWLDEGRHPRGNHRRDNQGGHRTPTRQRNEKEKITKQRMAELTKTSQAQVDRLLDPDNGGVTIESLRRDARIFGRELGMQLV